MQAFSLHCFENPVSYPIIACECFILIPRVILLFTIHDFFYCIRWKLTTYFFKLMHFRHRSGCRGWMSNYFFVKRKICSWAELISIFGATYCGLVRAQCRTIGWGLNIHIVSPQTHFFLIWGLRSKLVLIIHWNNLSLRRF